jgi:hypothetical protein
MILGALVLVIGVVLIVVAIGIRPGEQVGYAVAPLQSSVEDAVRKEGLPYLVEKAEPQKLERARERAVSELTTASVDKLLHDVLLGSGSTVIHKTFMKSETDSTIYPYNKPRDTYWITALNENVLVLYHEVYTPPPSPLQSSGSWKETWGSVFFDSASEDGITFRYSSGHPLLVAFSGFVITLVGLGLLVLNAANRINARRPRTQSQQDPSG